MSLLSNAFKGLLNIKKRSVSIERPGKFTAQINISPSNYSRNLEGPSDTVMPGREFVVAKANLVSSGVTVPLKRGDRITDSEMGLMVISEVNEMFDLDGSVLGYRVRTN